MKLLDRVEIIDKTFQNGAYKHLRWQVVDILGPNMVSIEATNRKNTRIAIHVSMLTREYL